MGALVHLEGNELIIREQTLMKVMRVMRVARGQAPPCLPALHELLLYYLSPLINY